MSKITSSLLLLGTALLSHAEIPAKNVRDVLQTGNQRFLAGKAEAHSWQTEKVKKTGTYGQTPSVGVLTCADSRVPVEVIFDLGVGDLFVCRNAGGFDTAETNATFEYGVAALGVHTILVLGHTRCGAVTATLEGKPVPGNISRLTEALKPSIQATLQKHGPKASEESTTEAAEESVRYQMGQLTRQSELLKKALDDQKLKIYGAIYEVETGKVRFLD